MGEVDGFGVLYSYIKSGFKEEEKPKVASKEVLDVTFLLVPPFMFFSL